MRRKLLSLTLVVLLMSSLFGSVATAAPIRVIIDGHEQVFSPAPALVGSSTLVPMRGFFEALGASVNWDPATRSVTSVKGGTTVRLTINGQTATVNGATVQLAVPAQIIGASTFVPLRFVGEALGANVHYAAGVITITSSTLTPTPTASTAVHFIDVGQGDSILIMSGDYDILIDAGERIWGDDVVAYLQAQGVDDLELVISTHPHADHIGGLPYVLESVPVELVIDSGVPHTSQTYIDYLALIDRLSIPFEIPNNQSIELADGVRLEIIGPIAQYDDLNNVSVVVMLTAGDVSVLLTGDMEAKAEADLLTAADLDADILKVGHHGSNTSSSAAFLAEVSPEAAVISCGEGNSYGHPASVTLDKLSGIDVYRTDLHGTVVVMISGGTYTVTTARETQPVDQGEQQGITVYITDTGTKYHLDGCRYLNSSQAPIDLEDAVEAGYTPCGVCKPPTLDD